MHSGATCFVMHLVFVLIFCPYLRAHSFEHLLKTIELVGAKIAFVWCRSTDNGRLAGSGPVFMKAYSDGDSVFGRLSRDF